VPYGKKRKKVVFRGLPDEKGSKTSRQVTLLKGDLLAKTNL